jgi:hypothetical protein
MAQLRAEQDRQRTQLLETQQTAIMALTGQQWVTIRQYVAIYDLHRQLPPSEQRAYATYLKGVSLERGIPVYKANTADAAWPQENTYFAGLIHETLLPWLTMRQSQSILLPPTEDIL